MNERRSWFFFVFIFFCFHYYDIIIEYYPLSFQGNTSSMKQYLNQSNTKINEIVMHSKKEMSESKRNKYSSVLISDVYHRDVIESFVVNKYVMKENLFIIYGSIR